MDGMLDYETAKEQWEGLQAAIAKAEDEVEALSLLISEKAVAFPREMAALYLNDDDKGMKKLGTENSEISERRRRLLTVLDGLRQAEAEVGRVVRDVENYERQKAELEAAKQALVELAKRKAALEAQLELSTSNNEKRRLLELFRDTRAIPKRTYSARRMALALDCVGDFDVWCGQHGLDVVVKNPVHGVFNVRMVN
jgi:hypothetical protein